VGDGLAEVGWAEDFGLGAEAEEVADGDGGGFDGEVEA
jgi:hypothetical protein